MPVRKPCVTSPLPVGLIAIDRDNLEIAESTTDHETWIELRNRYVNRVSGKIRFSHLERSSDFQLGDIGESPLEESGLYIRRYVRYFDSTDKTRDTVDVDLDFNVLENFDAEIAYQYETHDYDETRLGRVEEDRHEIYLSTVWTLPRDIRITGCAGYERRESLTDKRYLDSFEGVPVSADPNDGTQVVSDPLIGFLLGRDVTAYNFAYEDVSDYWNFSVRASVPLIDDKLDFNLMWSYQKHDGDILFSSEGEGESLDSIEMANDYTLNSVDANLTCQLTKQWHVKLGYMYQKYERDDVQTHRYQYTGDADLNRYWLTGAYADDDEENYIVYFGAAFSFGGV